MKHTRLIVAGLLSLALATGCSQTKPEQPESQAPQSVSQENVTETASAPGVVDAAEVADVTEANETIPKRPDTTNVKLAHAWESDFERLANDSGMEVCVSAIDLTSGTTAGHSPNQRMLSASMIKVLVAETFLGQVAKGSQSLDDTYTLKQTDIVGGAGSLGARGAGATVTKQELLEHMISESDNVAANVLIDLCGMDAINAEAKRLGLKETKLGRHMMDSEAAAQGHDNYTCASDLATLFQMVWDKTFVNEEMSAVMLKCLEAQTDNECISAGLPSGTVFAHKTGSLDTVRHDGGIVEGDRPFVLVTLCGGTGFSEQGALATMAQIGEVAYQDLR